MDKPEKMDVDEGGSSHTDLYVCEYTETNVNKSDSEGNTALHKAARHGDHETVAACIRAGAEVNIVNNVLQSPLFRASKFGNAECVQLLIQAGAKVNLNDRDGCTPIMKTAERGKEECLKLLIAAGANVNSLNSNNQTALFRATIKGSATRIGTVNILLEAGADVNFVCNEGSSLSKCILNGGILLQRRLLAAGATVLKTYPDGSNCLFPAAKKGNVERMKILLEMGADVKHRSRWGRGTPLTEAVKWGRGRCVELLIEKGAELERTDRRGFTPLIMAAERGDTDCLNILIDAGARVNYLVEGVTFNTALLCAARNGHQGCVEILRGSGATVNVLGSHGRSLLMLAATLQKPPQAIRDLKLLLKLGAHVNITSYNQQNAIEFYLKFSSIQVEGYRRFAEEHEQLVYLLVGAGEKLDLLPTVERIPDHIPLFLCDNEMRFRLKHLCREAIRAHLLDVDLHTNLFGRIPRLGLPSILTKFLLYNSSLD